MDKKDSVYIMDQEMKCIHQMENANEEILDTYLFGTRTQCNRFIEMNYNLFGHTLHDFDVAYHKAINKVFDVDKLFIKVSRLNTVWQEKIIARIQFVCNAINNDFYRRNCLNVLHNTLILAPNTVDNDQPLYARPLYDGGVLTARTYVTSKNVVTQFILRCLSER